MFQRRDIFVMKYSVTKSMIVVLMLCLLYYVFACWMAYVRLGAGLTIWAAILFGSGFAGVEVSIWLLMPFSEDTKRALRFLLGVNGAISAFGLVLVMFGGPTFVLFMFGLAQFFYFSCVSLQASEDVIDNGHGP